MHPTFDRDKLMYFMPFLIFQMKNTIFEIFNAQTEIFAYEAMAKQNTVLTIRTKTMNS